MSLALRWKRLILLNNASCWFHLTCSISLDISYNMSLLSRYETELKTSWSILLFWIAKAKGNEEINRLVITTVYILMIFVTIPFCGAVFHYCRYIAELFIQFLLILLTAKWSMITHWIGREPPLPWRYLDSSSFLWEAVPIFVVVAGSSCREPWIWLFTLWPLLAMKPSDSKWHWHKREEGNYSIALRRR